MIKLHKEHEEKEKEQGEISHKASEGCNLFVSTLQFDLAKFKEVLYQSQT